MGNVLVNENSLTDIGNAIREKNGSEDMYKPSEMGDAIRNIQSGSTEEGYYNLENATNLSNTFNNAVFDNIDTLTVYAPNLNGAEAVVLQSTFFNVLGVKRIKLIGSINGNKFRFNNTFEGKFKHENNILEEIDLSEFDFSNLSPIYYHTFEGNAMLKKIVGELIATGINMYVFFRCESLEEVRFKKGCLIENSVFDYNPMLTTESIQAIIDGLADLTDGTAQTLTFHATVKAKLTEEQIASITSKNWTLA